MNYKKVKFGYTIFCAAKKKASTIKYLLFLLFESLKKEFERERLKNMRCSAYFSEWA